MTANSSVFALKATNAKSALTVEQLFNQNYFKQ